MSCWNEQKMIFSTRDRLMMTVDLKNVSVIGQVFIVRYRGSKLIVKQTYYLYFV